MEDEKIIELYWNRSEEAINETDKKYRNFCVSIAKNIVFQKEDTEECVNDTYLGLWNAIPPNRPDILPAFIAKIVRNIAMNKITYYNAKKRSAHMTLALSELENCMDFSKTPESVISEKAFIECIEVFLQKLDYENRNIFVRRYWFFDSIKEIAERFQITENSVKTKLFRVRKKLKNHLNKEGYYDC